MPTDPTIPPPQPAPVPLTPQDEHLLAALFDPNADLLVAAVHVGMTEVQLIDWSTQPHIQQRITAQRALRRLRKEIRSDATARRTIDALEDIAHTADDPIERRRAAAAILRYLSPNTPRAPRREPRAAPLATIAPQSTTTQPTTPPTTPLTTPPPPPTTTPPPSRVLQYAAFVPTNPAPTPAPPQKKHLTPRQPPRTPALARTTPSRNATRARPP
ncbi:MAG: hypothetical protein Q9O74_10295 [Planctomycetota bacterium]|nr:hypothetical protein [Planctomycetota bacterium]